jgi:N-acetylmuramic acid 6-phosphate etherase
VSSSDGSAGSHFLDLDLDRLESEATDVRGRDLDRLGTADLAAMMNAADATVPAVVGRALPQITAAIDAIGAGLAAGGRLVYVGAGTPGRLGVLDASECPPTFDTAAGQVQGHIAGGPRAVTDSIEGAEDDAAAGAALIDELGIGSADAVVGISASGRTPYVLGAVLAARRRGAVTAAIVNTSGSDVAAAVEFPIEVVTGPEIITGSTRLRAGTAQKLVLNMLSTITMVKLGKTLGNLMVDVRTSNAKLQARAVRIVGMATGLDPASAHDLFERAGGETKTAIAVALTGLAVDDARAELAASQGRLRPVLDAHGVDVP